MAPYQGFDCSTSHGEIPHGARLGFGSCNGSLATGANSRTVYQDPVQISQWAADSASTQAVYPGHGDESQSFLDYRSEILGTSVPPDIHSDFSTAENGASHNTSQVQAVHEQAGLFPSDNPMSTSSAGLIVPSIGNSVDYNQVYGYSFSVGSMEEQSQTDMNFPVSDFSLPTPSDDLLFLDGAGSNTMAPGNENMPAVSPGWNGPYDTGDLQSDWTTSSCPVDASCSSASMAETRRSSSFSYNATHPDTPLSAGTNEESWHGFPETIAYGTYGVFPPMSLEAAHTLEERMEIDVQRFATFSLVCLRH